MSPQTNKLHDRAPTLDELVHNPLNRTVIGLVDWVMRPWQAWLMGVCFPEFRAIKDSKARNLTAFHLIFCWRTINHRRFAMAMFFMVFVGLGLAAGVLFSALSPTSALGRVAFIASLAGVGVVALSLWQYITALPLQKFATECLDDLGYVTCESCGNLHNQDVACLCGIRTASE